jgi:hypothetical protein
MTSRCCELSRLAHCSQLWTQSGRFVELHAASLRIVADLRELMLHTKTTSRLGRVCSLLRSS